MCQDYLHILRSEVDGILVGSNTVKIDDCVLNCRMLGLKKFSPIRILLNRNLVQRTRIDLSRGRLPAQRRELLYSIFRSRKQSRSRRET